MWKYFRPCSLNKSFLFNSTLAIEYNIQAMPFDPSLCAISFALYLETSILQELDSVLCSRHEISLVSTPYRSGNLHEHVVCTFFPLPYFLPFFGALLRKEARLILTPCAFNFWDSSIWNCWHALRLVLNVKGSRQFCWISCAPFRETGVASAKNGKFVSTKMTLPPNFSYHRPGRDVGKP